jgi:hypothetical protein
MFNRTTDVFAGCFAADHAKVTSQLLVGNHEAQAGLTIQNIALEYTQQVTRVYEIGTPLHYLVAGRAAGQANIGRISGPRKLAKEFYKSYGDLCRARDNALQFAVSTGSDGEKLESSAAAFTCQFVVITSLGFNLGCEDTLINEQLAMMFNSFVCG